jgi:hypothetical protein
MNVKVEWITLMLLVLEVVNSNFDTETSYSGRGIQRFS